MLKRCLGPRIFVLIHWKITRFPEKLSHEWSCLEVGKNTYEFALSIQR